MTAIKVACVSVFLVTLLAPSCGRVSADEMSIEYLGHIDVPRIPWDQKVYEAGRHFGYSRGAFCYVPERDSFLLIGHPYAQLFAEISNPGPGGQAKLLHDFVDEEIACVDGCIEAPTAPGLGVTPRPDFIEEYTVRF